MIEKIRIAWWVWRMQLVLHMIERKARRTQDFDTYTSALAAQRLLREAMQLYQPKTMGSMKLAVAKHFVMTHEEMTSGTQS